MAVIATRRERVELQLETNFPAEAAKAAAAIRLLNEEINHLGGRGSSGSALKTAGRDIEDVGRKADRAAPSIDKYSGRVSLLAKSAAALGPALIPIGAVGIPALTGLASSFGFAAIAGGTAVAAFQGVGDALKAMNDAALDPTAEHLQAAREAMSQISPQAREFVVELQRLQPELEHLRDTAAAGLFPGLSEGLEQMSSALPKVERIVAAVSGELGDIAASAGTSLGGARWADFFDFLATEAPQALSDMAAGVGNVAHAMAELWMAFAPLNRSFSSWLVDSTADLDKWASGLSKTQGFAEFVDYVQSVGPQVGATIGAIANALLQIVEAAAPIGGPVLHIIEALANAIATIADSDIGTPLFGMVAAFSALNLAMKAGRGIQTQFVGSQNQLTQAFEKQRTSLRALATDYAAIRRDNKSPQTVFAVGKDGAEQVSAVARETERFNKSLRETAAGAGKAGALVGAFALQSSGAADSLGVTNTVSLALAGTLAGPWGAAAGAAVGATLDLAHANDGLKEAVTAADAAIASNNIDTMTAALARANTEIKTATGPSGLEKLVKLLPVVGAPLSQAVGSQRKGDADALKLRQEQLALGAKGLNAGPLAAAGGLLSSLKLLPPAYKGVSQSAAATNKALFASRSAAAASGQAFIGLGKDVNNSKVSLNGWIHQMAQMASALRQFTANSLIAANRGLRQGLIAALQKMGPEGALRMKQLANGTDTQIKRANRAWASGQKAARNYTNAVGGGAQQATARISAMRAEIARIKSKSVHMDEKGAAAAKARIAQLRAAIAALRDKTVTVTTYHRSVGAPNQAGNHASGGFISGPGGPRDDAIPAWLSNGEFVVNAAATAKNRALLESLNGQNFRDGGMVDEFPGYKRGGHVKHPKKSNGLQHAIDRLTAAVETQTSALDDAVSKRNDLASTVSGNFLSDPFGSSNVWSAGGGAGGVLGNLQGDIAKANAFKGILAALQKNGVSGQALAAIASTGDVGKAQGLLSLGAAGDKQYTSLYNQRAAAANAVGMYAGNSVYGATISKDYHELVAIKLELKRLNAQQKAHHKKAPERAKATGHAVAKGTNKAATAAKHHKRRHGK